MTTDTNKWYCGVPIFVFAPFIQYQKWVGMTPAHNNKFGCVSCGAKGCLNSKGYHWRVMHNITGGIAWCLHRLLLCKVCKTTFAEIDPQFLAQLPNPVTEHFPFLMTTKGPGLHDEGILFQFIHLATKGVLFGTFTNMYNALKRLQHTKKHVTYLDTLQEQIDRDEENDGDFEDIIPECFPEYFSKGKYHGIDLTPHDLKKHFLCYMRSIEPYLQHSFQTTCDEGGSADHTYKTANKVVPPGRKGKLWKASITKTSLQGKIELSRFVHTQGNDEIEGLIRS